MQNPDKLEREGEMPPLDFGPKGGLRIKPFKDGVSQYMQSLGYNGYVQHGLVEYFTRLQNRIKQNDEQAPERVFEEFISEFQVVTENRSFNKARGFNYIHDDPNYENVLDQVLYNAKTMIETMGLDFFNSGTSKRPDQIWSAQIPNTTFRLNLEPGAGAGTFSLNFSISLDELGDTGRGKIWSMAMDFEQEDEELVARIIVTGSRVRLANLGASHKKDRYKDFAKEVGRTTSQRLLTFLCMYLAYDLGATKFKALSTEGAYKLSSLKRSKGKYDYSKLFNSVGIPPSENPNWHEVPDFQENFYSALKVGMGPHETGPLDRIIDAFRELECQGVDARIPLTVCQKEDSAELAKAIELVRSLYGKVNAIRR